MSKAPSLQVGDSVSVLTQAWGEWRGRRACTATEDWPHVWDRPPASGKWICDISQRRTASTPAGTGSRCALRSVLLLRPPRAVAARPQARLQAQLQERRRLLHRHQHRPWTRQTTRSDVDSSDDEMEQPHDGVVQSADGWKRDGNVRTSQRANVCFPIATTLGFAIWGQQLAPKLLSAALHGKHCRARPIDDSGASPRRNTVDQSRPKDSPSGRGSPRPDWTRPRRSPAPLALGRTAGCPVEEATPPRSAAPRWTRSEPRRLDETSTTRGARPNLPRGERPVTPRPDAKSQLPTIPCVTPRDGEIPPRIVPRRESALSCPTKLLKDPKGPIRKREGRDQVTSQIVPPSA
eukprot:3759080-Prymnesium_polylepis.1